MRRILPLLAAVLFVPVATAAPEPPALRLPGDALPKSARLDLTIRPAEPKFSGTIVYEVDLKKPLDLVWLNARGLEIGSATVTAGGKEHPAKVVPGGEEFAGLQLDAPAGPGPATLRLAFTGTLADKDTRGLFHQQEGNDWYVYSQFEATDARRAFPCFDEPSFKHPWTLTLHVPKDVVAVSNTGEASSKDEPNGMKAVAFHTTKPLPSYLVALGVGPFDVVDAGKAGAVPLRILTPKGQGKQTAYAQKTIGPLLKILEDYFGIPYPYEKLDALAIPRTVGFGAMENPGLITYVSRLLVTKPEDEGIFFRRGFASVAAHEMAHQWFGDYVTLAFWDDTWLNESFASWMGDKAVAKLEPQWETPADLVAGRSGAMDVDSLATARRIRQPIKTKDDIANAFDGITYGKGHAVLSMYEAWMGEDHFRRGVQHYLKQHAFGNATAPDFLAALAAEAHPEVPASFDTFLDQAGVPEVSVTLACADGQPPTLSLSQKRLLPTGSQAAAAQSWQVPMCVRYEAKGAEARECQLLKEPAGTMRLTKAAGCPAWVLANDGERGYYRASYQGDLLKRLLNAKSKLSEAENLGLIGDVASLSNAGEISPGEALGLVAVYDKSDDRRVLSTLARMVAFAKQRGLPEEELPAFGRFVQKSFGARARALGLTPKPGEDEDTKILRASLVGLVAIDGRDETLRKEALALAKAWLADPKAIGPDMLGTVLGIAADAGDAALFDGYLAAAKKETDPRKRSQLLGLLGSFRDPALSERALRLTLSSEFDARDSGGIFWAALGDARTRQQAWDFLKAHWDELVARMPEQSRMYMPFFGMAFCDEPHRADVDAFMTPRMKGVEGAPRNLAQTLERVRVCSAVRTAQAPALKEFLAKF